MHLSYSLNLTCFDCCSYNHFRPPKYSIVLHPTRYCHLWRIRLHISWTLTHNCRWRYLFLLDWWSISEFWAIVSFLNHSFFACREHFIWMGGYVTAWRSGGRLVFLLFLMLLSNQFYFLTLFAMCFNFLYAFLWYSKQ